MEQKLVRIILNDFKQNIKVYTGIFYSSILSLSAVFIMINMLNCVQLINDQGYLKDNMVIFMIGILAVLTLIAIVFIVYAFHSFIKLRVSDYSIYLILGITSQNLRLFIMIEILIISAFLLVTAFVVGIVISYIMVTILGKLFITKLFVTYKFSIIMLISIYFIVLLINTALVCLRVKNKGALDFLKSKKFEEDNREHWIIRVMTFILGIGMIAYSFILLWQYSVGKMFISMFLNFLGIYLIFNGVGTVLKKVIEGKRGIYYKSIIKWNKFFLNFKQNKRILFVLYIVNVVAIYIICGVATTVIINRNEDINQYYPFDMICITKENIEEKPEFRDLYKTEIIELKDINGTPICGVKESEFNALVHNKKYQLKNNEVLYYSQRVPEEFLPTEEKEIQIGKENYAVVDTAWKNIWGERLNEKFINIVVFSDEAFDKQKTNHLVENVYAIQFKQGMHSRLQEQIEGKAYYKELLVKGKQMQEMIELILFMIIGILLMLESNSVVYTKFFAEKISLQKEYTLYTYLGMMKKNIKGSLKGELRNIYLPVLVSASFFSAYLFVQDASYQGYIDSRIITIYCVLNLIFIGCQILYTEIIIHGLYTDIIRKGIRDAYHSK